MAIFNSSDTASTEKNTTIITQGAVIKGEIKVYCSLFIDGEVEGSITSKGEITIGEKGLVSGDIVSENILISGQVKGTVDSNRISILSGGSVEGIITSSELIIEAKGSFLGESKIKETNTKKSKSDTA